MESCDARLRGIIVGEAAVGKSCLVMRFVRGDFSPQHQVTIGVDYGTRVIPVVSDSLSVDLKAKLQIWDTAGQEGFRSIVRSYYRGAAFALLVYDVTRAYTLRQVAFWLQEVRTHSDGYVSVILVGNKAEPGARREVSYDEGAAFAAMHELDGFVETSAHTGYNVLQAFELAACRALERRQQGFVVHGVHLRSDLPEHEPRRCRVVPAKVRSFCCV